MKTKRLSRLPRESETKTGHVFTFHFSRPHQSNSDKLRQAQSNSLFSQVATPTILLECALRLQPCPSHSPTHQPITCRHPPSTIHPPGLPSFPLQSRSVRPQSSLQSN